MKTTHDAEVEGARDDLLLAIAETVELLTSAIVSRSEPNRHYVMDRLRSSRETLIELTSEPADLSSY